MVGVDFSDLMAFVMGSTRSLLRLAVIEFPLTLEAEIEDWRPEIMKRGLKQK